VAPQLSGGWQHNYSTKTREASHANEQSFYLLSYIYGEFAEPPMKYKNIVSMFVNLPNHQQYICNITMVLEFNFLCGWASYAYFKA